MRSSGCLSIGRQKDSESSLAVIGLVLLLCGPVDILDNSVDSWFGEVLDPSQYKGSECNGIPGNGFSRKMQMRSDG